MDFVTDTIGRRFVGPDGRIYLCFKHEENAGFWVRTVDDGESRTTCLSERAIGRTYHKIEITLGAWTLLGHYERLGRMPTQREAENVVYDLALRTLRRNGLVDRENKLTDLGRRVLAETPIGKRDGVFYLRFEV